MGFFSWLRNRTSNRAPRGRARQRPAAPRFRPRLEALEDRWLPTTLIVMNNLDSGPGSLRAEIAAAKGKDTIVFAPSLDGQTITLTSGELLINKNLTIAGPGAGQLTVSGRGVSRVFDVDAPNQGIKVALSGLTISNGYAFGSWGGGIYNAGENVTLSGCTLSGNSAEEGGAIFNYFGTMTVSDCTLSGNHADLYGGGICNFRGTMTVSTCTISGNTAIDPSNAGPGTFSEGGGIYDDPGANKGTGVYVTGCTLSDNSADYRGGAIFVHEPYAVGPLSYYGSNNVFSNNSPDNAYVG
jgi:hypothetical protein